jgi:hypothetical protein
MKRLLILVLLPLLIAVQGPRAAEQLTDDQIRQVLVEQSIRNYSGNCPCPYNTMRNGRRCGGNSAYSRPGGASPLCYPSDVSDAMVEDYRQRNSGNQ